MLTVIGVGSLGFLCLMGFCLMAINPRDDEELTNIDYD
jgi:hypothetical protein